MRRIAIIVLALFGLAAPALSQDFEISNDYDALPEAVRDLRSMLLEAAYNGDYDALKLRMDEQETPPRVSFGEVDDPIAYLKSQSSDPEGLQIMAVLADLLEARFGIITNQGEEPIYIWPYLAGLPDVSNLEPYQKVDAYRLLPPAQAEALATDGMWYAWRVMIAADGEWLTFVAGD